MSGLEPLACSLRVIKRGLWALQTVANPAYLGRFLFTALPCVAPNCVRGGIKVMSAVCGSRAANSFALDTFCGHQRSNRIPGPNPYSCSGTRWRIGGTGGMENGLCGSA